MAEGTARRFDRAFKLAALERMSAGENVGDSGVAWLRVMERLGIGGRRIPQVRATGWCIRLATTVPRFLSQPHVVNQHRKCD